MVRLEILNLESRIAAFPVQGAHTSSGGGHSSSSSRGGDFTERFEASEFRPFEAAAQRTTPASVALFGSSDVDFTGRLAGGEFLPGAAPGQRADAGRVRGGSSLDFTRRFDGGNFESTNDVRGGAQGIAGSALAGAPGASRDGQRQGDLDGPLTRGMSNDDPTGASIRIPFRPSSSGTDEMERRGMMSGRGGSDLFPGGMLPNSFFSRPGEARRSNLGNRF